MATAKDATKHTTTDTGTATMRTHTEIASGWTFRKVAGKGTPEDTCNSGVPSGMKITNRRFVVDPDIGAVVVLSRFSNNELPDSHLFRLENGKIRYVHTLTVCTIPGCGFQRPTPPQK